MTEIDLIKRNTKCLCVTFFSCSFISLKLFDGHFSLLFPRGCKKKRRTMVQKKVTQRVRPSYSLGDIAQSSPIGQFLVVLKS